MKPPRFHHLLASWLVATVLFVGCGHKGGDGHDHAKGGAHNHEGGHGHGHGHGHGEESSAGASFKPGKGVIVTEETRKLLGLEVADVIETNLPNQIRFTVQVFGEQHHHPLNQEDHSGCDVHGAGLLATNTAAAVKPGQPVELIKGTNSPLPGVVLAVRKLLALGEAEILVGVSNAAALLKAGDFIPARLTLAGHHVQAAIPQTALLVTSEGAFVYVINGEAYFRTAVKTGNEAGGWVEVTDGLLAGDQVVTRPVQTLWLIELRATKGGGHSH
jgi:hypothetical protein